MKRITRVFVTFITAVLLFGSLSVTSFAACYSFGNLYASSYSQKLVDVTCNYYSLKKDSFTVKNNGTIPMIVHVNGCYVATINPGKTYTRPANYKTKERVQVYAQKPAGAKKQNVYITSTSGVIYKN